MHKYRIFVMESEKVKGHQEYDHVGVKNYQDICVFGIGLLMSALCDVQ